MKTLLRISSSLFLLLTAGLTHALATANYVYHERSAGDVTGGAANTCGGAQAYVPTLNPSSAQSYLMRFKVEYQFGTDQLRVYYTTDGSTPSGSLGAGSGTTTVINGNYQCTFTFGANTIDVCNATIPAQPAGTVVKYRIGAWKVSDGVEVFANSGTCGGCAGPGDTFQYTVGSTTDLYWDSNGSGSGAGATPTGTWGSSAFWSTVFDGTAATGAWIAGRNAIFSAGSDAVNAFTLTTSPAQSANSITVEEGTVNHSGTSVNTLTVPTLNINSGAKFSVLTASTFTPPAGSVCNLNGGTIENRNTGTGSSFLTTSTANANMRINLVSGGSVSALGGAGIVTIYTGLIQGTGPLNINGNGVFRLTTTVATYSGPTVINGTLQMSTTANVLPSGTALTINSGGKYDLQTLQTVASLDGGGNLAATSANELTVAGTASTTYSGVWSGGRLHVNKAGGVGTLTLDGVNTSSGRFTLTAGTVTVNPTKSLCGPIADLHVNGGTLNLNNPAQSVENLVGTAGGTINLASGHVLTTDPIASGTFAGIISGGGGLRKLNGLSASKLTLTLSGANTYDGNTLVASGIVSVASSTALGSTAGYTEAGYGGEVLFTGLGANFTCAEPFRIAGPGSTDNGAIAVIANANPTLSGPIELIGDAIVTVSSSAGATFSNPNSFTSFTNHNLTLAGAANGAATKSITGVISLGNGGIVKTNGGEWILSGLNTYAGATMITNGTLSAAADSALGTTAGSTVVASGAALGFRGNITYSTPEPVVIAGNGVASAGALYNLGGNNSFAGPITMTTASSIGVTNGTTLTLSGSISGGLSDLNKVGGGGIL